MATSATRSEPAWSAAGTGPAWSAIAKPASGRTGNFAARAGEVCARGGRGPALDGDAGGEGAGVAVRQLIERSRPRALGDGEQAARGQALADRLAARQPAQRAGQRLRVGGHEAAAAPVLDQLGRPTRVHCEHRKSAGLRLEDDLAKR